MKILEITAADSNASNASEVAGEIYVHEHNLNESLKHFNFSSFKFALEFAQNIGNIVY